MLYCPETILSLVRVLQSLSACQKDQRAPDAYVAFTIRNPETCQLFTTELGELRDPDGPLSQRPCRPAGPLPAPRETPLRQQSGK